MKTLPGEQEPVLGRQTELLFASEQKIKVLPTFSLKRMHKVHMGEVVNLLHLCTSEARVFKYIAYNFGINLNVWAISGRHFQLTLLWCLTESMKSLISYLVALINVVTWVHFYEKQLQII